MGKWDIRNAFNSFEIVSAFECYAVSREAAWSDSVSKGSYKESELQDSRNRETLLVILKSRVKLKLGRTAFQSGLKMAHDFRVI